MLKTFLSEVILELELVPKEVTLVKAKNREEPDTSRNPSTGQTTPYLPGSSLKGIFRSYAEMLLRSFDNKYACDPFATSDARGMIMSCSDYLEGQKKNQTIASTQIYRKLCPACKVFGCTSHIGRFFIEDAYPLGNTLQEIQTSTAIDRFTGGVKSGALFNRKPLSANGAQFKTTLTISNFELWQVGLIGLVLRDINEGYQGIGSGSRTGYGKLKVDITEATFSYNKQAYGKALGSSETLQASEYTFFGTGNLIEEKIRAVYGYQLEAPVKVSSKGVSKEEELLKNSFHWNGEEGVKEIFFEESVKILASFLQDGSLVTERRVGDE